MEKLQAKKRPTQEQIDSEAKGLNKSHAIAAVLLVVTSLLSGCVTINGSAGTGSTGWDHQAKWFQFLGSLNR